MRFEHVLTELLRKEFTNHQKNQSDIPDFFTAALKLATISSELTRNEVVSDVAKALDCDQDALEFMFEQPQASNVDQDLKFPCYRASMIRNEEDKPYSAGEDNDEDALFIEDEPVRELSILKAAE